MSQFFTLQPFTPQPTLDLSVTGEISRIANQLAICYRLQGDLKQLLLPLPQVPPQRRFALWEVTCFELFLAPLGEQYYWEFNLAPSGDWNLWRLDSYRQGLQEEVSVTMLPSAIHQTANTITLDLALNLDPLLSIDRQLEVAVTTVIQKQNGEYSYWALQHTGGEADFHRRADFAIDL